MADEAHDQGDQPTQEKPEFELPDGYANEDAFLSEMRQLFYDDVTFDRLNREAALEDLRFAVGDQWEDAVRQRREAARKPVLTINRLPAFVAQIVGNRRLNETTITVLPDNGGTIGTARVREGLMRNIQKVSYAELAYDKALEQQDMCGIGNFQVELDYESDDVFDQIIKISPIPDPLAVVWDRTLVDGTGRDAKHVFVVDTMTKDDFFAAYPWATPSDVSVDVSLRGDLRMSGWIAIDDVRVVAYWTVRTRKRMLALLKDGSTADITDLPKEEVLPNVMQRGDGSPIMREVNKRYAQRYLCSGMDILEGPYNLPIPRVPVLRVPGWEVNVGEYKHRWGLIRHLKDPQRLHNYWRSVIAEKIMQTPRAVWLAAKSAVAGREEQFRNSHLSDNPLLIWNDESANKPERVPPATVEDALLGQAEITNQDIKDVSNIHEANLGMPSNEVSGAAIIARQRVSDTGTILYHDNLAHAIEQAGYIINELIPVAYDTPRIIKVLGADAKQDMVAINQVGQKETDITSGKYSVTVVTGPSYQTKRIEAAQNMMNLANAMPQTLAVSADLIVEAQDWPGADKIAKRIRKSMPPGLLEPDEMTPDMLQAAKGAADQSAQQKQVTDTATALEFSLKSSEAAMNAARARNYEAQADSIPKRDNTQAVTAASQSADRELRGGLEAIKVAHTGG